MKKIQILLATLFCSVLTSFAQTGPAGVGNFDGSGGQPENIIWLDASTLGLADGANVTTWSDLSGNGNDLIQQGGDPTPLFETNGLFSTNYNAVRFDGTERYLVLGDNADLDNSLGGITVIAVIYNATLDGSPRGIYSKRVNSGSNRSYNSFTYTSSRLNFDIDNGSNRRLASGAGLNTSTDYISTNRYSGSLQEIYLQSVQSASASISGNITDSNSSLFLGALNNNYGTYFDGDIAELIFYREGINDGERLIVENYLSQKYGITIANDFFSPGLGSLFVNDFMGIGTGDGSAKLSESGSSDALQIAEANGSLNSANEFIMMAHDNVAHDQTSTANLSDPDITDRWARSWYLEATGNVSAELKFDFPTAGLTFGNASDYVLLYRANTTDDFVRILANSYSEGTPDQLVVDLGNISLPSGYYTVGRGTPLVPGHWYSFQNGNWTNPDTWTLDPSGALRTPLAGGVPASTDNVTIIDDIVTMDIDNITALNLQVDEKLIVGNTSGHSFFNISGGGTISISGDGGQADNFPTGSTSLFADPIVGGTLEVLGSGINLDQDRLYNNMVINLGSTANLATLTADYTVNGDLTITRGTLQINDNGATISRNITVQGNVQIDATGELNVGTGNARHEFNFYGDFNNSGRAEFTNRGAPDYGTEASDGIVDANFLSGNSNQTIDCFGVTNFYRIEIDKGVDQTYILDINASSAANFNLFGPADYNHASTAQLTTNDNNLGLLRGTVRLNLNVDVPVLNNSTGNYNISESARLWVNGGSAEKPAGTAIVPYGTIQISDGILNAPVNSGITTRANGNIVVEGGTVTVNQIRTSVLGTANIGGYTQSGGTVNVTGNNISTSYYAFSLTYPGNTFNMSAGTLNVAGAPTGANTGGIFIASSASNQSVTGGTVVMEINRNDDFKVTSLAPFWNVIMRYTSGTGSQVDLINGASGTGANTTNITSPDLRVLNDLTIESGVVFDHNGFDVEIGSDFTIQATGDYIYDGSVGGGRRNTTTINGVDDATLTFLNRTGGTNDEQRFWNLIIDKPTGRTVSLASGKVNVNGNNNNLLRVDGDALKVLSGTLDQGFHSIRVYTDSLVNYDQLTVYSLANATPDANPNSNNDLIKFRPDDFVLVTADTSRFGNVRLNNGNRIVTLISDLKIDRLEYRHGRLDLGIQNLKIDVLARNLSGSQADWNACGGCFSVEDMFITGGNSSDGGLSLYVPADGIDPDDGDAIFDFPFGIGTDGSDVALSGGNSKYTPAQATLSGVTDDGYITIRSIDNTLPTTDPSGGDLLSYYWKVDFEDFTTPPTVEYLFTYYDDDLDGSANEATFTAGKVLEEAPFDRDYEDEPATEGVDDTNNTITFNGTLDVGFTLESASYTAGEFGRFVGAPEIYYSRRDGNWNLTNRWSTVSHTGAAAGDFPQAGDVAIIGWDPVSPSPPDPDYHRMNAVGDVNVAILEFNSLNDATAKNIKLSRLTFDATENLNAEIVRGIGELHFQIASGVGPGTINASSDLGDFVENKRSSFIYNMSGNGDVIIPALDKYPSLRFYAAAANSSANKNDRYSLDRDIECANLLLDGNAALEVTNNILVLDTLFVGANRDGELIFNNGAVANTVETNHLIFGSDLFTTQRAENINRIFVETGGGNGIEHRLIVNEDILIATGSGGVYPDTGADFDLFTTTSDNNVILELRSDGNNTFEIEGDDDIGSNGIQFIPEFYRIVMNKGTSLSSTFDFNDGFTLEGDAAGTTKALELQNGLLRLNSSEGDIDIDLTTGGDDFNIPSSSGLQVTQATVNVSGTDTGIALDGSLIIDGGTVNLDDVVGNNNNYIEYSASGNAIIDISSGSLDVGSQIRPILSSTTGILKYRQTGGDVRIGTQAAPENTRGMLQIYNVGSEFTYTGGTLTIERHQDAPSIAALYLDPDVSDVTGSTITIFNGNTPALQTDFRINSTIALNNLTINGTNSPSANLNVNALTIDNQLTIASNATLNGSALTLTVGGDMVNDGTYDAQGNETIFNTSTSQGISGGGTNTFFKFTKEEVGTLTLTNAIGVADLFTITEGTVDDSGNDINLAADAVIDGTHLSVGGQGLVFGGAANQELRRSTAGTGSLGMVTINNANGVTIPTGGYDFNINSGLRLNGGVFDIGTSSISFGSTAEITPVTPFSVSNMILTNGSITDGGVRKELLSTRTTDFTFPMGQAFYTPVTLDFTTGANDVGSTDGSITVTTTQPYHPTIDDGTDALTSGDVNNVLQYYWTIFADNITGITTDMSLQYQQAQVLTDEPGVAYDEDDYLAARIRTFDNALNTIDKFDVLDVDETTNIISFSFNGISSAGPDLISGDYFAGNDEAIPDVVATYIAQGTGGDIDQEIYDIPLPLGAGTPPSGAVVIIPSGATVRVADDNLRLYRTEIQDGGVLEIDNSTNHLLGILDGTGTLKITSDGINATLPAFSGSFLSCTGGGLEYAGGATSNYTVLGGITSLRNLTFSGDGVRNFANNNVTVCEDLVVDGPITSTQSSRTVRVNGDLTINSGTLNSLGTLNVFGDITLNGGNLNGGSNSRWISAIGNLTINSGSLSVGSSNYQLFVYQNFTFSGGSFDGGSSNAKVLFYALSSFQTAANSVVSGDFTGSNSFRNVTVNKDGSGSSVNLLSNIEITNDLILTDGIINGNGNTVTLGPSIFVSPTTGSSSSYIAGKALKTISSAGSNFTFPIGSSSLWRPATVNNVSAGGLTWEAEYFQASPTTDPLVDNLTPTTPSPAIATISDGEYWKISDGNDPSIGTTATVGLSWGIESDVSSVSAEREELKVMIWNDGISSWDNLGGVNFLPLVGVNHTQSRGRFVASIANTFSEQIFTLGSANVANALPITLESFTGYAENGVHYLEWVTSSEINNDYFELQRSIDGLNYEVLTTVEGAGTTTDRQSYSYIDVSPVFGKNYYRLVQVDIDGKRHDEGDIILLENTNQLEKMDYKLYPNPTDRFNINLEIGSPDTDRDITVSLYDLQGRRYYRAVISADQLNKPMSIEISNQAKSGMYIVIVEQGELVVQKKLLIQ